MDKMNFIQFTEEIVNKIKAYLPENYLESKIMLKSVIKNNGLTLTALVIYNESNISPSVYLEGFYEKYKAGMEMEDILRKIAELRIKKELDDAFDISMILDFDKVKNFIIPKLIKENWNKTMLKNRPHTDYSNLTITYHIVLEKNDSSFASMPVTDLLMKHWGIDLEAIHKLAIGNMKIILPSVFKSINEMIKTIDPSVDLNNPCFSCAEKNMYVLSNEIIMFGATALLDEEVMNKIEEKIGKEFYVLPSSVHEVIIIPKLSDNDVFCLSSMVREMNNNYLSCEDRLSDNIYKYTHDKGLTMVA